MARLVDKSLRGCATTVRRHPENIALLVAVVMAVMIANTGSSVSSITYRMLLYLIGFKT